MKKTGPDRKYTEDFRQAAVQQVLEGGRRMPQVARSLEVPYGTLTNWVLRARKGEPMTKRSAVKPVTEVEAEVTRLRAENARLKLEKEILKKAAAYFAKEST
jgi:transposase